MTSTSNPSPISDTGEKDGATVQKESLTDWYVVDVLRLVHIQTLFHFLSQPFALLIEIKKYAFAVSTVRRRHWLGHGVCSEIQKGVGADDCRGGGGDLSRHGTNGISWIKVRIVIWKLNDWYCL